MAYKFTETNKVNDEFTKVFGIGFKSFYDGLVSIATKQLWIDIVKFDEWLQKKHGNYEAEGKSLMDVVREHYGDEGVRLVDALTGEGDDSDGPKSEETIKKQKPQEIMEPKTMNERIAMAMLRQCALVWEHCTVLAKPVIKCECKFADIYKGMYGKTTQRNDAPIGRIDVYDSYASLWEANKANPIEGVYIDVKYEFVQLEVEGFRCSYRLGSIFDVTRSFCMGNGCTALMNKTVFGIDSSGKFARLPEVKKEAKKTAKAGKPKQAAKAATLSQHTEQEPTLAERLREVLLRQLKQAA